MGIDYFSGEIIPKPYEIPLERTFNKVEALVHGEEAYVTFGDWFVDLDGKLWVHTAANAYSPDEIQELITEDFTGMKDGEYVDIEKLCRLVCLEVTNQQTGEDVQGFVVDCSPYNLEHEKDVRAKLTRRADRYQSIESARMDSVMPVFGLLKNEIELDEFKKILEAEPYHVQLRDNVAESVEGNDD